MNIKELFSKAASDDQLVAKGIDHLIIICELFFLYKHLPEELITTVAMQDLLKRLIKNGYLDENTASLLNNLNKPHVCSNEKVTANEPVKKVTSI